VPQETTENRDAGPLPSEKRDEPHPFSRPRFRQAYS
jgi:hypothetical protein